VALAAVLALMALAAAAGCGGSSASDTPAAGATPTAIQVMATATRGDLTQSAMGAAKVTRSGGKLVAVATIDAQSASSVAEGQSATVFFMRSGSLPQAGQSGVPQPQGSGVPQPQGSGMPQGAPSGMPAPGASGMPQGGASGAPFPQGGQGGLPGGVGERGGTAGTVTTVEMNPDGTASATISLDKLPSGAKAGSTGFARIEVKVLASDVVLIPTAAVEGSGDSATVQVVANGKTETRTITAGRQSGAMTEVTSGLEEGENVVYSQSFQGFPGGAGGQSGMPVPQGGQAGGQPDGSQ
jgi:macrolide-specific efflux system membrane fusion protein